MTDKTNPSSDPTSLIVLGVVALAAIGGVAFWLLNGKKEEPVEPVDLDELVKEETPSEPKTKRRNNKKKAVEPKKEETKPKEAEKPKEQPKKEEKKEETKSKNKKKKSKGKKTEKKETKTEEKKVKEEEVDEDDGEWEEVGKKNKKGTSFEDKQKKIQKLQQAYLSQF